MNWKELNKNNYLKWGITLILFLLGLYFMMKSYAYADEYEVPLFKEFMFQYYECKATSSVKRQNHEEAY